MYLVLQKKNFFTLNLDHTVQETVTKQKCIAYKI